MSDRGKGVPRSDVERVMQHYNVDEATAKDMIAQCGSGILPPRGTGLQQYTKKGFMRRLSR
jgi:hypothetical protein